MIESISGTSMFLVWSEAENQWLTAKIQLDL